ncbi:MAG: GspE/PulE family protein [Gammaproteobacteria bacterium]
MANKIKLGNLLVSEQVIEQSQLDIALEEQRQTGEKLGDVLIRLGFINDAALRGILAKQLKIPFLELKWYGLKPEVIREIPEHVARRCLAIPIDRVKGDFLVAISDPGDLSVVDELTRILKKKIRLVASKKQDILHAIDHVFRKTQQIEHLVGELEEEIEAFSGLESESNQENDAPVIKLLNSIFEDSLQMNASDIHIEPDGGYLRIRQRVDGVLQEQVVKAKHIVSAIVMRLKLVAKLDISEKRLPQDGRFTLSVKGRRVDFRISTLPVKDGESVVLRVLDQAKGILTLNDLGMPEIIRHSFEKHLHKPHGMILVTGPTGSGKTTTLYAGMSTLNSFEKKIITIEDPIEYSFPRINQVQVNPNIGLTFSSILRSALRQDPDIVMVGEIRDEETAAMALRAAMTGHLVLSTLHTNDAMASPSRLIEMGVEPFLVSSALRLVVAQRLVRRVCMSCQEVYKPSPEELIFLSALMESVPPQIQFLRGKGCVRCRRTGYRGRIGVYEVMELNKRMADTLRHHDMINFYHEAKQSTLYRPLVHWALDYACQGITSIEEVIRIAGEIE